MLVTFVFRWYISCLNIALGSLVTIIVFIFVYMNVLYYFFYRSFSNFYGCGVGFLEQLIRSHVTFMNNNDIRNYRLNLNQTKGDKRGHIIYVGQILMLPFNKS